MGFHHKKHPFKNQSLPKIYDSLYQYQQANEKSPKLNMHGRASSVLAAQHPRIIQALGTSEISSFQQVVPPIDVPGAPIGQDGENNQQYFFIKPKELSFNENNVIDNGKVAGIVSNKTHFQ